MIKKYIKSSWSNYWAKRLKRYPGIEFQAKHIDSTKILVDRLHLLELLPKDSVIAEIGVDKGDFSRKIIDTCNPQTIHLVDMWSTKRYNEDKKTYVHDRFKDEIAEGQVKINIGLSTDVVSEFPDAYFDWIYIDTDHSYETTLAELRSYSHKVKNGGIIAGHDYVMGNWMGMVRYGVMEAVRQFCVESGWQLIYVTANLTENPSFAIRQIS